MVCALEALGYGSCDCGLLFSVPAHAYRVGSGELALSTRAQRQKYLPRLINGDWIGALAITESESGSDAFAMETRAVRQGDSCILNGAKVFVTNASCAKLMIVFARLQNSSDNGGVTAFAVERGLPGVFV